VVLDDVDAGFFFSSSLSGLRNDGGGGGGAGGAGGGLSFCSATSSLFTKSTSEITGITVLQASLRVSCTCTLVTMLC